MHGRTLRTPRVEERFLKELAQESSVSRAAKSVGTGRSTVYQWRENDVNFAKRWDEAIEDGTDRMEDEAVRRGVEGVEKPVYYKGEVVGHLQEYSDLLLDKQLRARRKGKYSDRTEQVLSGQIRVVEVLSFAEEPEE